MEIYSFNTHNCNTVESVVERINDGPVQGFEQLTSNMLAASYAADAAVESGYTSSDSIEAQLDYIAENGAIFDKGPALDLAVEMAAAIESGEFSWV